MAHLSFTEQAIKTIKEVGLCDKDSDYEGLIGKSVIQLLKVFKKQGHSGMSAEHTAHIFSLLVKYSGFLSKAARDKAFKKAK